MEEKGKLLRGGTVVDVIIIEAPTSTKTKKRKGIMKCSSNKKDG